MGRKRKDQRGELARTALIEAAEELFAEKGVENVSIREIGKAIGSDNNAVVTYYFGNKSGLLQAIYEYRIPELEQKRSELLDLAESNGLGQDVLALLYVLLAPIFKQRNSKGAPSYAGFLASIAHSPDISMVSLSQSYPVTRELADRLRSALKLSEKRFWRRLRLISAMIIEATKDAVEKELEGEKSSQINAFFIESLQMASLALSAPLQSPDGLRSFLKTVNKSKLLIGSPTTKAQS